MEGHKDDVLTLKTECEAKIGNAYYATLADAFAAANKTGDTVIELLDDINMTGTELDAGGWMDTMVRASSP